MPINSVPVRQELTAETLRILYNECAALRSIDREHEQYFMEKVPIGTTLQIKRPWRPQGRQGQSFQPEAIIQTTVPLTISYWRGGDFIYNDTDEQLYLDMDNFHEEYSRPMGVMIANQIDSDLLSYMQVTTPNFVGVPGTLPTTTGVYNAARTNLNKLLAPSQNRRVIWTSDFEQNMVGLSQTLFNPSKDVSMQYVSGMVGEYAGFQFLRDEQIPGFTVGTYAGAGVVDGAGQQGNFLVTKSWTSSSLALNPGDRFTIAGVYKVNPSGVHSAYSGAANLMQFVVQQSVTDSAGAATINFYPALISSGQFQNSSASPADGAAVSIVGNSGVQCNTAFAFQREAFTAAFLKLSKPSNVEAEVMGGKESGTPGIYIRSLKQWQNSGPYAGYETERMDVIYGFAAQYADYFSCVVYG
jgi:hypothetical protein